MEKEIFEKSFIEKLNNNFPVFAKYFDFNLKVFCEFNTLIFEINKCLILELNRASITLTNNLLERLLKLALINNETGIGPLPIEKWNDVFSEPNKKYGSIPLGNSIEKCKKLELITTDEKTFLFDTIRQLMRNGFSHADSSKILSDLPDESKMFQGSLINPNEDLKEVRVNQKIIPTFQALQMERFANENAKPYFDFVFKLIFRIEKRLLEKQK
ncbi:hypothetical protein SAMN04487910_2748 [Aquimarina amphilecti]|uniref:Uncharacterized protein n=1 Tax=Aquimarina amphilecti TaxID=1038014 RepID=A0A1H7R0Z3_AQUAM|nr:hypothetical protein [Aquimarina amphilecti]SEL53585.1 hypothetical protein SAMN04487910_2748 [Aquimarina amphilecti]